MNKTTKNYTLLTTTEDAIGRAPIWCESVEVYPTPEGHFKVDIVISGDAVDVSARVERLIRWADQSPTVINCNPLDCFSGLSLSGEPKMVTLAGTLTAATPFTKALAGREEEFVKVVGSLTPVELSLAIAPQPKHWLMIIKQTLCAEEGTNGEYSRPLIWAVLAEMGINTAPDFITLARANSHASQKLRLERGVPVTVSAPPLWTGDATIAVGDVPRHVWA